jgi:hypothetical protein
MQGRIYALDERGVAMRTRELPPTRYISTSVAREIVNNEQEKEHEKTGQSARSAGCC